MISENNALHLMQWNMLSKSDFYCSETSFPKVDKEDLNWENRAKAFKRIFNNLNPDMLCLEEVEDYDEVKTLLNTEKYDSVYYKKQEGVQGLAFFYDKNKLRLIDSNKVTLPTNEDGGLSSQVFWYAFVQENQSGKIFCVVSTHLKAKLVNESIRLSQVRYLLKFIDEDTEFLSLFYKHESKTIILCGDFNAEPDSSCIQHLINFKFNTNKTLIGSNLISAYNYSDYTKEDFLEMTTFKLRDTEYYRVIDYIFYCGEVNFIKNTPTIKKADTYFTSGDFNFKGFPNADLPSDHYYLNLYFNLLKRD